MVSKVYLVLTCSIPRMAGKFLEAPVESSMLKKEVLFKPCGGLGQQNLSAFFGSKTGWDSVDSHAELW